MIYMPARVHPRARAAPHQLVEVVQLRNDVDPYVGDADLSEVHHIYRFNRVSEHYKAATACMAAGHAMHQTRAEIARTDETHPVHVCVWTDVRYRCELTSLAWVLSLLGTCWRLKQPNSRLHPQPHKGRHLGSSAYACVECLLSTCTALA